MHADIDLYAEIAVFVLNLSDIIFLQTVPHSFKRMAKSRCEHVLIA